MAEYFPIDVSSFGSYSGSFSGSFFGNGSRLTGITASFFSGSVTSASYAATASYLLGSIASASYSATASYVNPLVQNVIITGSIYIPDSTNSIYFSGSGPASRLVWNETDGTLDLGLKGGNVTLQIGQESVIQVVNKTGANLLEADYKAVRIRRVDEGGAQGQRLAIVLAQADNDANSVDTLGLVTEDIAVNQEGFITNSGLVRNIDTTGTLQGETWVDGDVLYLSPTISGSVTKVKPQAPQHTIVMGYVVYAHANNGKIFVKVDNGYELDELHNVRITTASLSSGDLLVYSSSVWINTRQLTGSYGITGSLQATSFTGSLLGTASNAVNALTASFVNTASTNAFVQNGNSFGATALLGTNDNQSLAFETSGSTRMFISSSGRVGIGTITPSYTLDTVGNVRLTNAASQLIIDNATYSELNYGSTNYFRANGAAALISGPSIQFLTAGTERARIDSSGDARFINNVIVTGSITTGVANSANGTVTINRSSGGTGFIVRGSDGNIVGAGNRPVYEPYNYADASHNFNIGHASVGNYNWFVGTNTTLNLNTQLMRLTRDGNLLIGTTTDSGRLTVKGSGATSATTALRVENTNASASLVVRDDSSVGIGTNTPISRLSVVDNNGYSPSLNATASANFNVSRGTTGATNLVFTLLGVSPFTAAIQHRHAAIDGISYAISLNPLGGNVGIGTNAPTRTLQVVGGDILIDNNKGYFSKNTGGSELSLLKFDTSNNCQIGSVFQGGGTIVYSTAETVFYSYPGSVLTERMRIANSTGNVGIGISTPIAKLQISGSTSEALLIVSSSSGPTLYVSGSGNVGIGTANPASALSVVGRADVSSRLRVGIAGNPNYTMEVWGDQIFATAAGAIWSIFQQSTERLGIGTSSPSSKLHVKGAGATSATTTLRVENTNASASLIVLDNGTVGINRTPTASLDVAGTFNQGSASLASGLFSHVQGFANTASGIYSHAEGAVTQATGNNSHAEGINTQATNSGSHAEGSNTISSGASSHAEGNNTIASGSYSHAEGDTTKAIGIASHAEGQNTIASGNYSHTEGDSTQATGKNSHAEGNSTQAIGDNSHTEGLGTVALGNYQHVQGQYNISSSAQSAFIIGNGVDASTRSNLVFASGSQFQITGSLQVGVPGTNDAAIDTTVGTLSRGTQARVDWLNGSLYNTSGVLTADWENTSLYDGSGVLSLAWNDRVLYTPGANSFAWNNEYHTTSTLYQYYAISLTTQNDFIDNLSSPFVGQIIEGVIDAAATAGQLVNLEPDGIWYPVKNLAPQATKMLGICVNQSKGIILLEGDVGVSDDNTYGTYVVSASMGLPVYVSTTNGELDTTQPGSGVIRIVGHIYYQSTTTANYWLMKFRPSNNWT